MPSLTMLQGDTPGLTFVLHEEETVVGRHASCDVRLPSLCVSKRHCRIVRRGHDYFVEDLRSRSGIWVNGRCLTEPHRMADGDVIGVCAYLLAFSLHPSVTPSPETPARWVLTTRDHPSDRGERDN
jgi:pSer/pThr/pTyr-binding forkhead associated (FHA) protein